MALSCPVPDGAPALRPEAIGAVRAGGPVDGGRAAPQWRYALWLPSFGIVIEKLLSGEPVETRFPEEQGVLDAVMDYARTAFQNRFHMQLIVNWIEESKPDSLRFMRAQWGGSISDDT